MIHDFSTTYCRGSLHSVPFLCDIVVRAGGSTFHVILVTMSALVGAGLALSMATMFGIPSSSMVVT